MEKGPKHDEALGTLLGFSRYIAWYIVRHVARYIAWYIAEYIACYTLLGTLLVLLGTLLGKTAIGDAVGMAAIVRRSDVKGSSEDSCSSNGNSNKKLYLPYRQNHT